MQKPSKVGELAYIIIDCQDNLRVATFWSNILGLELETEPSPPYIDLVQPPHGGPKLSFQQVEEPKATKNRLHMDIQVPDLQAATEQIVALGGRLIQECVEPPYAWRVMADPEGNEFCIVLN